MKKVLAVVVGLVAVAAGYAWYSFFPGTPPVIHIATEGAYPPFNSIDNSGTLVGFDIDIANALCEKMRVQCKIDAEPWDGIIPALLERKYDAIVASMTITAKRKEQVNFTDKYYSTAARFVAKKGANIEVTPAGLTGKRVGVQRSTVFETYLRARFPEVVPVLYDTQENANLDIAAGRLDLLLADSVQLSQDFLKTDKGRDFEFVGPPLSDPTLGEGVGIAVRKDDTKLLEAFNKALKEIRADGTYKKLNDKYFDFDIYGN
jgi:arginine/ornithine transport system substrate-binding protein